MVEFLSIVNGIFLGVLLGMLRPAPRLSLILLVAIALAAFATAFGATFRVGSTFLSLDLPLITISASLSLFWARRRFVYARQKSNR